MASPPAGWLTAPGPNPTRRALELLGTFLDDEQQEQAQRWGGFAHEDGLRIYWIRIDGGAPRCAQLDRGVVINYCVAPQEKRDGARMPGPDVALTHLMWIRHDPSGFLKEANVIGSWEIPNDVSGERLLELLANEKHSPRPRVRRPQRFSPPPRKVGLMNGRDLGSDLGTEELKEFFTRNNVEVSREMLRKLAAGGS